MPQNENNDQSAIQILQGLNRFVEEVDPDESIQDVRSRLAENGIDTARMRTWAKERVGAMKAQEILAKASSKRHSMLEAFESCKARLSRAAVPLKGDILERIQALGETNPSAAQVFCRKFEEASDEDLAGLHEDLTMLGEMEDKAAEGDA
ncbi:MAG: hypothetical protein KDN22_34155 [Verrucomicrobiae bacterium]|nr:hypothetical protein [Verrucomicrobiae bacterium]